MPSLLPLGLGLWPSPSSSREGEGGYTSLFGGSPPPTTSTVHSFRNQEKSIFTPQINSSNQCTMELSTYIGMKSWVLGRLDITEKGYFVVCSKGCSSPPPLLSLIFVVFFYTFGLDRVGNTWRVYAVLYILNVKICYNCCYKLWFLRESSIFSRLIFIVVTCRFVMTGRPAWIQNQ